MPSNNLLILDISKYTASEGMIENTLRISRFTVYQGHICDVLSDGLLHHHDVRNGLENEGDEETHETSQCCSTGLYRESVGEGFEDVPCSVQANSYN